MNLALLTTLLLSFNLFATPKKVEFWFLSPTQSPLFNSMFKKNINTTNIKVAFNCVPMGDGCFHPQHGYTDRSGNGLLVPEKKVIQPLFDPKNLNEGNSNELKCDSDNYFDIYCGKTYNNDYSPKIEIWVDISSSMRAIDYSKESDQCARRSFVEKVLTSCTKNIVDVSIFDTSIKQMGGFSSLCVAHGTNNQDRLIRWIENSSIRHLIVISDIGEYTTKLDNFLKSIGAYVKGIEKKPLISSELLSLAGDVLNSCKKIK